MKKDMIKKHFAPIKCPYCLHTVIKQNKIFAKIFVIETYKEDDLEKATITLKCPKCSNIVGVGILILGKGKCAKAA